MRIIGLLALLLTGCATIVATATQECEFVTLPAGQTIEIDGKATTTPAKVSLSTTSEHTVKWPDGTTSAVKRAVHPAYYGNAVWLLGAIVGVAVDLATGAATRNLSPRRIEWHEGKGVVDPVPRDRSDTGATRWD